MKNKRIILASISLVFISLLAFSCYYDSEEALYPSLNNGCDTSNVTFSATITPLINNYCISCHSGSSPSGGVLLNSYTAVKNVASTGMLMNAVKGNGVPLMPPSGSLSDCKINQLSIWIRNGMANN